MSEKKYLANPQSGFALPMVLILLLILASVVFVIFDGQRAKLLQSEAMIMASKVEQDLHNTHRACLNQLKAVLDGGSTQKVAWWTDAGGVVNANDARWSQSVSVLQGSCLVEVIVNTKDSANQWTPKLRITTRVIGSQSTKLAQTEWRYPACDLSNVNQKCVTLSNVIGLRDSAATWRPVYRNGQAVLAAHRMY